MSNPVDAYLAALKHPLKPAVQALRTTILAVSPSIGEEIKWNSPSFFIADHFATINLGRKTKARPADHLLLILHRGVKARPGPGLEIDDPSRLLEPLGKDRYAVTFHSLAEVKARAVPLQGIIRQWIDQIQVTA